MVPPSYISFAWTVCSVFELNFFLIVVGVKESIVFDVDTVQTRFILLNFTISLDLRCQSQNPRATHRILHTHHWQHWTRPVQCVLQKFQFFKYESVRDNTKFYFIKSDISYWQFKFMFQELIHLHMYIVCVSVLYMCYRPIVYVVRCFLCIFSMSVSLLLLGFKE